MDAAALVIEATTRANSAATMQRMPALITMAEDLIERTASPAVLEASGTVTTDSDGIADLPADFKEPLLVRASGSALPSSTLVDLAEGCVGYALLGTRLHSYYADTEHTLYYRSTLPSLNGVATNAVLESHPELYLHALIFQIFTAESRIDEAAGALTYFTRIARDIRAQEHALEHATESLSLTGVGL